MESGLSPSTYSHSMSREEAQVIELIDARSQSHLEKRARICPERLPNGVIQQGNISQSALKFDESDKGPSTFSEIRMK